MTQLDIRPIAGSLGAEIHGIDLKSGIDRETIGAIEQALLEHLVVFLPEQNISAEQHIAFGEAYGSLTTDHPSYLPTHPDHKEIVVLAGQEGGRADLWHTDITISPEPPMGSILHMRTSPEYGGDTMFANLYAAYDALSDKMKTYLEGVVAYHDLMGTVKTVMRELSAKVNPADPGTEIGEGMAGFAKLDLPSAHHPVIRTHPKTGRKCLFVNPTFTSHIVNLPMAEGDAVLDFLYRHSTQPEFLCRRRWTEGDIGFWDNRCTMHYAIADYSDAPRVIHRVTIQGEAPT
ncbi:MAG: TauD/TfdA family dioxygenase [Candidatus Binatia bacterium]|nr:TauD/TfdA family dioxygenase [Candidatus Binatia bacterium]